MEEDHGFCLLMKYELALLNFTEINKASLLKFKNNLEALLF